MSNIFVRSTDGSDADGGTTWALAKATIAGALAIAAAGDVIWVSQVHAESGSASNVLASPGTAAAPCLILCGNDSAEPPTSLATTGSVTTTSSANITCTGFAYCYGIQFLIGSGASNPNLIFNSTSPWWWKMDSCKIQFNSSGSTGRMTVGVTSTSSDDQFLQLTNTVINMNNAAHGIVIRCPFEWTNTSAASFSVGTVPTTAFLTPASSNGSNSVIRGVNLANISGSLVDAGQNQVNAYYFENCKLNASVTPTTGTNTGQGGCLITLVNCDSGDTNYKYYKANYQGTITTETTIVKSSGASDGTTPISRKMVSSANSKFFSPLVSDPSVIWNETTGSSVTCTIEIVNDGATLNDDEIWIEVDYSSDASFPQYSIASDRKTDYLATAANQTTSSVTWTTTGLSSPVKQKLVATFTPANKGVIKARVCLAKPSTTIYYDPLVVVT